MKFLVCPELPTASVGSSQATTAAVDNSASFVSRPPEFDTLRRQITSPSNKNKDLAA